MAIKFVKNAVGRMIPETINGKPVIPFKGVHQYKTNRVFCLVSGHDHQTWEDENFKTVLKRGIEWSCGKD